LWCNNTISKLPTNKVSKVQVIEVTTISMSDTARPAPLLKTQNGNRVVDGSTYPGWNLFARNELLRDTTTYTWDWDLVDDRGVFISEVLS